MFREMVGSVRYMGGLVRMDYLERWVGQLKRWVAKLKRWAAQLERLLTQL